LTKDFCVYIYQLTKKFPDAERFGITSQMRRAAISICSNIAEGSSRISQKDQSHFYTMAFSSTMELLNQLIISKELMFMSEEELEFSRIKIEQITKNLSNLKRSTLNPKP
jgi:four helix bundle protein